MTTEQRANDLVKRIELMKNAYLKGCGHFISEIRNLSEPYLNDDLIQEEYEEVKNTIIHNLAEIEEHYAKLPFEQTDLNSDFAPLFVTDDILSYYGNLIRGFLEKPTEKKLKEIYYSTSTLADVGNVYRHNFKKRIDELRAIKGYEDFRVEIVDNKGNTFFM